MSEKTVVTIDCGLIIPEGVEKVFENQHIRLEAGIEGNGTLILRNCTIEPCAKLESKDGRKPICKPGCIDMGINGKLEMEGCEVVHPGQNFLSGWNMTVRNTSFLITPNPDSVLAVLSVAPCIIAAHGETRFVGCSFVEEAGNSTHTTKLDLMSFNTVNMDNCTFKNITGRIEVASITGCSFTGCASVDGIKISGSTFTDCGSISVNANDGYIKDCGFVHVKSVYSAFADITGCRFHKIEGDIEDEGVIGVEDCTVTNCSFDDIELRNGAYLIDGIGNVTIEHCQFTNCRTVRTDLAICYGKIETGKLRKQWVTIDILDESTCSGYDEVQKID